VSAYPVHSDGAKVREARLARGWRVEKLAAEVPCSVPLVVRLETEPGYTPTPPYLNRICLLLGLDPEEIVELDREVFA
jgi:transcriptional regulator with XRE-family HTH domain